MGIELSRKFIKTDKNGTKHYQVTCKCDFCGGTGYKSIFSNIDNGVCYDCNGTGIETYIHKEYTPEYAAKKAAKEAAIFEKLEQQRKQEVAAKWSEIFPENKVWFVVGDSFAIKDEIKADGGKWLPVYRKWYFTQKPTKDFQLFEVDATKVFDNDCYNNGLKCFMVREGELVEIPEIKNEQPKGEYVGEVGKRIEIQVQLDNVHEIVVGNNYSYYNERRNILVFKDESDNVLVWNTTSGYDFFSGKVGNSGWKVGYAFTIKATVKEHSVYKGVKQTCLNRCKIIKEQTFDEYEKETNK